jgi:hypothetical protein
MATKEVQHRGYTITTHSIDTGGRWAWKCIVAPPDPADTPKGAGSVDALCDSEAAALSEAERAGVSIVDAWMLEKQRAKASRGNA